MITNPSTKQPNCQRATPFAPQFIVIWLPDLPIHHEAICSGVVAQQPIALYEQIAGSQILRYLCPLARAAGLQAGMRLTDARSVLPVTRFRPFNRETTDSWLQAIGKWAWRYSPVVGMDTDNLSIWIDMTGASHFYADEAALLTAIQAEFAAASMTAHIAIAPTYGAAFALAHFRATKTQAASCSQPSDIAACLADLPVAGLRVNAAVCAGLRQSGLRAIGDIIGISRSALHMRFGAELVKRCDQALGRQDEVLQPLLFEPPVHIGHNFHEPLAGLEPMHRMVADLVDEMAEMLARRHWLTRQIEIGWQRVDGRVSKRQFRLSRPRRDPKLLHRLTARLAEEIDAEFGLEYAWISADRLSEGLPETLSIDKKDNVSDSIDQLVDHLGARLGYGKVQALMPRADWQPESSQQIVPAEQVAAIRTGWALPEAEALQAPRPLRLVMPAQEVRVLALLPDHPPAQVRLRHKIWQIKRATGPERIGPRWWDEALSSACSRDYYRLESEEGARLWVYREGLPERGDQMRWFLQGYFA